MSHQSILTGIAKGPDFLEALKDLSTQLKSKEAEFTIFFVSNKYQMEKHSGKIKEILGARALGCSTAGEISPQGIAEHSISGFSFHSPDFKCELIPINNLDLFPQESDTPTLEKLEKISEHGIDNTTPDQKNFGLLLLDGLSCREEVITGALGVHLPNIPIVGASSGDGLNFKYTTIYFDGVSTNNRGALLLVATTLPFKVFKLQHFKASNKKIVVTQSDPTTRTVFEIDGSPAADAYAESLGVVIDKFDPNVFSSYPVMIRVGDENYVRSIQKVNQDKSLTFYCAIDDGIVLTLAEREQLFETTVTGLNSIREELGSEPLLTVMFECILRRLEILQMPKEEQEKVKTIYRDFQGVGFHTYGEQFGPIHINQTLTGVMIGRSKTSK